MRTKSSHNKIFHRTFISNRNEKTQILMNKPVYLGFSVLDLSKTIRYKFWYDYVNPKYDENRKLYYMDTDSFIRHVKTDDIFKDTVKDIEKRFDTLSYETDRPLSLGKKWTNQEKNCWIKSKNR